MELNVKMWVSEDRKNKHDGFDLIALYPGMMRKSVPERQYWNDLDGDDNPMKIAHLMERAYRLNYLVIYKASDLATQNLINFHLDKKRLNGKIDLYDENVLPRDNRWQGSYRFDFKINRIIPNNTDEDGNKWDIVVLRIIDKTESIDLGY